MGWDKRKFAEDLVSVLEDIREKMRDIDDGATNALEAWERFYAALASGPGFDPEASARIADAMCVEWGRRFALDDGKIHAEPRPDK